MWSAMTSLGWALWPGGQAAGQSTADSIATIIAADVAAHLREHPGILDLAEQARQMQTRPEHAATWPALIPKSTPSAST